MVHLWASARGVSPGFSRIMARLVSRLMRTRASKGTCTRQRVVHVREASTGHYMYISGTGLRSIGWQSRENHLKAHTSSVRGMAGV